MDIIILAGGFGTRMKEINNGTPKALMKIDNMVFLDYLLEKVFKYVVTHVYLSLHYKPEFFHEYIKNFIHKDKISAIVELQPLGTGGAVKYVINNSNITSPFVVINGDSLSDIKLDQMFTEFENSDIKAMVGISEVEDTERYGTVVVEDNKVLSFNEKGVRCAGWINNGHYIFKREAFDGFSNTFSLEKSLFPKLVQEQELWAFKVDNDNFIDMGIPEDYKKLNKMHMEWK